MSKQRRLDNELAKYGALKTANAISTTAFLLALGICLLSLGFAMIALTSLTAFMRPIQLFLFSGIALFVIGSISVLIAWKTLR